MMVTGSLRAMEAQARRYRHTWRASVFSSFLSPVLFLLAMGVGLGSLVDERGGPGGISYLIWLAPGLIMATAMQVGFGESTYPVLASIRWTKTYHSALSTPLVTEELVIGHLGWVTIRLAQVALAYGAVAAAFGAVRLSVLPAVMLAAVLTGLAFSAPTMWFTAALEKDTAISSALRFGITPLFLFSGTFFPIEQLPVFLRPVAYLTPLWHGVELARTWTLGIDPLIRPVWHVLFLSALAGVGAVGGARRLRRRLVT
jgi:lipooligosaccharide transport system permease protein